MLCIFTETNSHSVGGAAALENVRGGEIGEAAQITRGLDRGDMALRAPRVAGTHPCFFYYTRLAIVWNGLINYLASSFKLGPWY